MKTNYFDSDLIQPETTIAPSGLQDMSQLDTSPSSVTTQNLLNPGEVIRTSGKFAKPTKIPGKNYTKDEVVIRNADSGKGKVSQSPSTRGFLSIRHWNFSKMQPISDSLVATSHCELSPSYWLLCIDIICLVSFSIHFSLFRISSNMHTHTHIPAQTNTYIRIVMGIKGRRVHMIEELSETIISFQRGNQTKNKTSTKGTPEFVWHQQNVQRFFSHYFLFVWFNFRFCSNFAATAIYLHQTNFCHR